MSANIQEELCIGDLIRKCNCDDCPFDNKPAEWDCCCPTIEGAEKLVYKLDIEIQKLQEKRKIIVDKLLS